VTAQPRSLSALAAAAGVVVPLRLLRQLVAVADHGSASQAALALHQSVSAVTRGVQQAETLLGLPLFDRGARGMAPTPAGALLVVRAARALAELRKGAGASFASRASDGMLQALSAVAATRSEGGAAARLGLSQPAVHATLRQLEHAARLPLFERSRRGTRLTESGEALLRHASLAQAELRGGHDELAAFRGLSPGQVTVGALPMTSEVLVPQALSRLFAARPGVRATVVDGTYEALLHQLRHGDLDLMVGPLRGDRCPADIDEQLLFVDRLLPVVRGGHPLLLGPAGRARRGPRSLRALLRWPWIGPLPDTPARAAFERAFVAAGLTPPAVQLQANSPSVMRAVLHNGDAVALVSPLQIRADIAAGTLVVLPVPVSGTERAIGVSLRRGGLASPACRALLQDLQAVSVGGRS
jgi:LysR family transcriptional regulator, regulator for genes of the gallate degradation pathway